jgi:hypothetical protein
MNIRAKLIIDEFARHRAQFEYFCRALSPQELGEHVPGAPWSVRDYIAHLCTIDGLIAVNFSQSVGLDVPPPDVPIPQPFDIDEWNEAAVRARRQHSVDALLQEAAQHRNRLTAAIARMDDAFLDRTVMFGGDRKVIDLPPAPVPLGGVLWAIAIHDPTHTSDILKALPHRAEERWVRDWLDSVSDYLVPEAVLQRRA